MNLDPSFLMQYLGDKAKGKRILKKHGVDIGRPTIAVMTENNDMVQILRKKLDVVTYNDVQSIVREVDFDIFVTGPDQNHEGFVQAKQWCKDHGKEVVVLPRTDGVSSSELKHHIKAL